MCAPLLPLVLTLGAVLSSAACGTSSAATDVSAAAGCGPASAAQLVPADGAYLGVNLDPERQTLEDVAAVLGHRPAASVVFTDFPFVPADEQVLGRAVEQVRVQGGLLLLTLEPHGGLDAVTDAAAAELATRLDGYNDRGVPVVVRFGAEMNGRWYAWGQQPFGYVAAFRRIALRRPADRHLPGSRRRRPRAAGLLRHLRRPARQAGRDRRDRCLLRPGAGGNTLAVKQAWWAQVFDPAVREILPRLAMVNWVEREATEAETGTLVDWRVLDDPAVAAAFGAGLPAWGRWAEHVPACR